MKNFKLFDPMKDRDSVLPDIPGNYLIVLRESAQLPQIKIIPELQSIDYEGKHYQVIYTGISTKSIRERDYKQHFTGNNAGKSTLRKSIGSLMGFSKIPRDKNKPDNRRTKFKESDENSLSKWMKKNLLLFYNVELSAEMSIEEFEKKFIDEYNPPLNILGNNNPINKDYRVLLKDLRNQH